MPLAAREEFFRLYNRHLVLMEPFDEFFPKHHLVYHLLANMEYQGNPKHYDTWLSESLNELLKGTCRHASQYTFEETILVRMARLLRERAR